MQGKSSAVETWFYPDFHNRLLLVSVSYPVAAH